MNFSCLNECKYRCLFSQTQHVKLFTNSDLFRTDSNLAFIAFSLEPQPFPEVVFVFFFFTQKEETFAKTLHKNPYSLRVKPNQNQFHLSLAWSSGTGREKTKQKNTKSQFCSSLHSLWIDGFEVYKNISLCKRCVDILEKAIKNKKYTCLFVKS